MVDRSPDDQSTPNPCQPTSHRASRTTTNYTTHGPTTSPNSLASSKTRSIGLTFGGNLFWLTKPRSEYLQPMHYPYIQTLELTTILALSPEKPSRALKSFAEENSIKLVKHPP